MSDLMREEFGAWFSLNAPDINTLAEARVAKHMIIKKLAFLTWQASRECLVIELPADAHLSRDGLDEHYLAGDMRDQIVESIHAAGVKTK